MPAHDHVHLPTSNHGDVQNHNGGSHYHQGNMMIRTDVMYPEVPQTFEEVTLRPPKWEYYQILLPIPTVFSSNLIVNAANLDAMGQEGWELCGVIQATNHIGLIFKRPDYD